MKLKHLLEDPIYVDTSEDYKSNNKPTNYDWFYEYALTYTVSREVVKEYKAWRKRNPNDHVNAFLYEWQCIIDDPEYHKGDVLLKYKSDMSELDAISDLVGWDDNDHVVFGADLDLSGIFVQGFPEPDFKFKEIKGLLDLDSNRLTEFPKWLPEKMTVLSIENNDLKSFVGIDEIVTECKTLMIRGNDIQRGILSLLNIKELRSISMDNAKAAIILEKHLRGDRDILDCQSDLIDAGFGELTKK